MIENSNENIYVGIRQKRLTAGPVHKLAESDIVFLQCNPHTLGNFTTTGQIAVFTDLGQHFREVAIFGQANERLHPESKTAIYNIIAFTNDFVSPAEAKRLQSFFDTRITFAEQDQLIKQLLNNIHHEQVTLDSNLSGIKHNIQQFDDIRN